MSTAYQHKLLENLLLDAEKRRNGATLAVQCPASMTFAHDEQQPHDDDTSSLETFYLHPCIVANSSGYFERFPHPQSRVIQDIDANIFQQCCKFMYLGEVTPTLDSVAELLAAAEFLAIDELSRACFAFLESNLSHSNYETVHDMAERFQNVELAATSLRFAKPNEARDELVTKKRKLATEIQETEAATKRSESKKEGLTRELESVEQQWMDMLQKDLEAAPMHAAAMGESHESWPFVKARPSRAVARLVVEPNLKYRYEGVSVYDQRSVDDQRGSDSEDEDYCVHNYEQRPPPPPPTKEEHDELGIMYTHCSFKEALEDAKPGDRIYLGGGTYDMDTSKYGRSWNATIQMDIEIVGWPGEEVILLSKGSQLFCVDSGSLRIANLTLMYRPGGDRRSGCTLLKFESESKNAQLFVQDCTFDMGSNAAEALSSCVSGIFLAKGKSARIERCKLIGGGGSSITVLNDPQLSLSTVELVGNVIVNNGQPTFAEISTVPGIYNLDLKEKPLPEDEIPPGPAAVELWRLNRECYRSRESGKLEEYKTTTVILLQNRFSHNMRAAFAYRALSGSAKGFWERHFSPRPKPTAHFYTDLAREDLSEKTTGFMISLEKGNVMESNGLEFTGGQIARWMDNELTREAKRLCVEKDGKPEASTMGIPDGESLLAITQVVESYSVGFPYGFDRGEPFFGFCELFRTSDDYSEEEEDADEPDYDSDY